MTAPRMPWLALLIIHLAGLIALSAWVFDQTRPVAMHDLHLGEGEKLKCVSYAPYHLPGQTPFNEGLHIPRAQIAADLSALAKITECVRLYSIDQGLDQVPQVAREAGLTVLLGAWIGRDKARNAVELERAIAIANANADVVKALIVGNEVLLRQERTEDEMRALIEYAKARTQVPVTYADVWEFWTRHDSLARAVDFVTVHILPFWEDEPVDIEHALRHVTDIRAKVAAHFNGKRILIGETGWPSAGRQREESKPSRVNQARYVREFIHQAHSNGWDYNLIEAIDQPWKRRLEGTVGGYWGMLDAATLQAKFPLAGPVAERQTAWPPFIGAALGAALCLLLGFMNAQGATSLGNNRLRMAALATVGAFGGLVAILHAEHARLAYRDLLEWIVLGGIALLGATLPPLLACWRGNPLPNAASAWHGWRHGHNKLNTDTAFALSRGLLLFAAAVAALLLFADPRYRDFPSLLYLTPAALFCAFGWSRAGGAIEMAGRAERLCAATIALAVVGRWATEPANPQAIGWLLTGLALALPVLVPRLPAGRTNTSNDNSAPTAAGS